MTTTAIAPRLTPRLIVGLGILTLGILGTLDNLDLFETSQIADWWPLIIIGVGLVRLLDPRKSRTGSVLIMIVGAAILLDTLDFIDVDPSDFIPLAIALLGGKLVLDALGRRAVAAEGVDPAANITAFAIMSGVRRQSTSTDFRGGDATAIMGGVEIDLRNAQILDPQGATLDTFAMWGGVEIIVPDHWRVVGQVMPLMGGFDDKTLSPTTGPTLVVRGAAVMGAVVVKNVSDAPTAR